MTIKSPRRVYDDRAFRSQSNIKIAEAARRLVDLIKERIDAGGRISLADVNRVVINHRDVGVVFVDESDWPITEWRERSVR